jgi:shikimate dehydrogenase
VIGDPVDHSLSPTLHNAAFAQLGLDWVYVAFPVPAGRAEPAVAAMVDLGIRGLSVTMPHKAGAARACHRLSPVAQRLGVANTVTNRGGELVGDSTDGPGLIDSLADLGWSPEGKHCLVLGAGGAARAVALSLADSGARQVEVVARQPEQAEAAAALAGRVGTVGSVKSAGAADLVLNATPVGMGGPVDMGGPVGMGGPDGLGGPDGDGRLLPLGLDAGDLGPGQLVADLIYAPATTPLIAAARARGATACNGLGMLIYQAARQLNLWTGREAPVEAMSAAALAELARRAELASRGSLGPEAAPT